ncbi:hypothetical protein KsCSTR_04820 [Candidatus Kuenenia stuttgartiensis]|uniref:Uncharacterized protein n=1 Tax=Kuenenia stuttgartiensis TaxID=174633 RepID=Q1Q098_KUEST|nr:hypothetical protein KsCSTR_04820 [Candidatus Kuenenia stuttgartiensis]CAJ72762.1 unknown protein [Candidatus Kuenenia stuttgartiensis]
MEKQKCSCPSSGLGTQLHWRLLLPFSNNYLVQKRSSNIIGNPTFAIRFRKLLFSGRYLYVTIDFKC